ncbi:histidine phosphatase family protein [Alicyclobacillus dauci]|uniref:Histidine phosphatase family protein n=1 Tax=Alicyclobacillus dauci TaxID=1475485 RepID=A0ABY6Z1Q1_9BACL|nr:histidine phosphatase family protein [Alicyclobacillus dauci]WAH36146.1 histidine phosphatase family protein [Alicyclobacillus dauci]
MRLILLRHGETDWNKESRIQGAQSVPINRTGIEQVRRACISMKAMYGARISAIVASPLLRAKQSADICGKILGLQPVVVHSFRERSFGDLEGKTKHVIQTEFHIDDVESLPEPHFQVEAREAFINRLTSGLEYICMNVYSGPVLLVTHGSVIRELTKMAGHDIGIIPNAGFVEHDVSVTKGHCHDAHPAFSLRYVDRPSGGT